MFAERILRPAVTILADSNYDGDVSVSHFIFLSSLVLGKQGKLAYSEEFSSYPIKLSAHSKPLKTKPVAERVGFCSVRF